MEHQPYFVVVLAHSLHGRLRRVHIPHHTIYAVLVLAAIGSVTVAGFALSYARMVWKTANYNSLRREVETLRTRYRELQNINRQKNEQLATLETFAGEVSVAYGLNNKASSEAGDSALTPTWPETLQEYNLLKTASLSHTFREYAHQWQTDTRPGMWPVMGRIQSPFGARTDPFSGEEGARHTGVDISAPVGTPVKVTADGVVVRAEWAGRYGRLVVVDHGNNVETWYAHLSRFEVVPGQEVRRGDVVAETGASGHVTGPHLHYEVRIAGMPMNPYKYLSRPALAATTAERSDSLF